ncbi:SprT family zinc-dependent metalloprotease [Cyclobacterium plantarum]|uniref:SprT family zinc-dependent metalloprotease n=1 Tax=Cyclobacterium plantarum TaxID=2716263 RepID=A0ABX0HDS9_9BACT|nr:SprT family zinc-dependent metalloprotease [Cyclobacterium plantarum]NHE58312.1 SprT family zinc-dependent metalloprotease [Cyclobacterium plantarum]
MNKADWNKMLENRVPEKAIPYCYALWEEEPFHFEITRSRISKLGDFRYRKGHEIQKITINHDLNPYQFLITFVHEVAHHRVFSQFKGVGVKPHGPEWKRSFRFLMAPLLHKNVFPMDVLIPLRLYLNNPKASTGADFFLMKELKKYDRRSASYTGVLLGDLKTGAQFGLRSRIFEKLETKRSRVLCMELSTGRKYLISRHAEVVEKDDEGDVPF